MESIQNTIKDRMFLTEAQQIVFNEKLRIHDAILRKHQIRIGKDLLVPIKDEMIDGRTRSNETVNAHLISFVEPSNFKTTFKIIDKCLPELIKKAEDMDIMGSVHTKHKYEVIGNLKRYWFGLLQAQNENQESLNNLF